MLAASAAPYAQEFCLDPRSLGHLQDSGHSRPLVIFDVDGTLTATTGVDDECLALAWSEVFGIPADEIDTDWTHYEHSTDRGLTLQVCRRALRRDPTGDEFGRVQRAFFGGLRERSRGAPQMFQPVPGAAGLLAHLREGGWAVGIASGAWEESARIKLDAAGLDVAGLPGTFSHARADGEPARREEIVAATIARLGGLSQARPAAARAVYIGDGLWDARAARALNIGFVGIRIRGDMERMRSEGVQRIVRNYHDLPAIIEHIREAGKQR